MVVRSTRLSVLFMYFYNDPQCCLSPTLPRIVSLLDFRPLDPSYPTIASALIRVFLKRYLSQCQLLLQRKASSCAGPQGGLRDGVTLGLVFSLLSQRIYGSLITGRLADTLNL